MRINMPSILMIGFAALSTFFLVVELRVLAGDQYALGSGQTTWNIANFRGHISLQATHRLLMSCDRSLSVPVAYLRPKDETLAVAETCLEIARSTLSTIPTHGFAYFIAALAEHHRNYQKLRDIYLEKSVNFTPFEGWLAERRFVLAMNPPNGETVSEYISISQDIATLLDTQSGAELLANYYTLRPKSRHLIAAARDTTTQANQARLSNQLIRKRAGK